MTLPSGEVVLYWIVGGVRRRTEGVRTTNVAHGAPLRRTGAQRTAAYRKDARGESFPNPWLCRIYDDREPNMLWLLHPR